MKPTLPYGSLPIMEVIDDDDDSSSSRTVTQSIAMLRFAGKLAGLYPMDAEEALLVDEVIDVINNDVTPALFGYRGDDRTLLQESREKFVKEAIPRYVDVLDKRLGEEMMLEKGPFVLGDHVSIADLMITNFVNGLKQGIVDFVPVDCVDHCENLMRSYDSVMSIPQVKEWYQKYKIPNVTEE